MKECHENADAISRGSTHTFIFTHAPIVDGIIEVMGQPLDATHVSPNDYNFVDWVMNKKPEKRPNIEAVFCGHTHNSVWDYIYGLKGIWPNDDRDIDYKGIKNPAAWYEYEEPLLCIQVPRSTG